METNEQLISKMMAGKNAQQRESLSRLIGDEPINLVTKKDRVVFDCASAEPSNLDKLANVVAWASSGLAAVITIRNQFTR